jgi:high-affinity iron transporter
MMVWQAIAVDGNPNPLGHAAAHGKAFLDISILVFREGLESILVLAAITASMTGSSQPYQRPIAIGVIAAMAATVLTWFGIVGIIMDLTESIPALHVQAATGLLAIIVLLVVMNWFFHKVYWTGWIAMHTKKKKRLLSDAKESSGSKHRLLWGMATLGFTSFYREGFEVVLFLQSYRLRLGTPEVMKGLVLGLFLTGIVAILTFAAHQRLPYKKMLILTGILLGVVLLVMVGEQAQEMQLAGWIPTTVIPAVDGKIPGWIELWFAVFPTREGLTMQIIAGALVVGSYVVARIRVRR